MVSSLPVVAQHHFCHLAHIHNPRVVHPFQTLATASKQFQHPRVPASSRRQGEVLPSPNLKQAVMVTDVSPVGVQCGRMGGLP